MRGKGKGRIRVLVMHLQKMGKRQRVPFQARAQERRPASRKKAGKKDRSGPEPATIRQGGCLFNKMHVLIFPCQLQRGSLCTTVKQNEATAVNKTKVDKT